jgi:hypothetical protein
MALCKVRVLINAHNDKKICFFIMQNQVIMDFGRPFAESNFYLEKSWYKIISHDIDKNKQHFSR